VEKVEEEEHQRPLVGITRVLNKIERRPAIGQHAAEFTVKVGVPRWQPSNRLNDCRVFSRPVVASAGQDFRPPGVEPGVHPISMELYFVQPVGAVRCRLNELGE